MLATRGAFDAMMVAFPCSTFSASRLFPSEPPGPPPVRSKVHPDGLPDDELDPKYKRELRLTNTLLERTVQIIVAARNSSRKTTIILENPADRSIPGTKQYGDDTATHGSIWATAAFKQLASAIPDSSMVTFAYCRFGSDYQKYTTLWYTNEAGPILDQLNSPVYQCNHARHPKVAGGRLPDGTWASTAAAAYPAQFNIRLAMALTLARTGDPSPVSRQAISDWTSNNNRPDRSPSAADVDAVEPDPVPSAPESPSSAAPHSSTARRPLGSPLRGFPDLDSPIEPSPILGRPEAPRQGRNERTSRSSTLAQRNDESYTTNNSPIYSRGEPSGRTSRSSPSTRMTTPPTTRTPPSRRPRTPRTRSLLTSPSRSPIPLLPAPGSTSDATHSSRPHLPLTLSRRECSRQKTSLAFSHPLRCLSCCRPASYLLPCTRPSPPSTKPLSAPTPSAPHPLTPRRWPWTPRQATPSGRAASASS